MYKQLGGPVYRGFLVFIRRVYVSAVIDVTRGEEHVSVSFTVHLLCLFVAGVSGCCG